ncbi:MAG: DNA/RNA non-specific endonuclease, partial [Gammaproteobacteria bacterium]|nr:DNA/RNA non-specific endonuclease [Gammaproteobacteria bacterium]
MSATPIVSMMKFTRLLLAVLFTAATYIAGYSKIGVEHQMVLGNPSNSTADPANNISYLIQRDQFALDYNDQRGVPNWVSWNLTTDDLGSSGRSPVFFADPDLPPTFYVVQPTDYQGSGYDRGHMCPSGDRTITRADNDVTFYMSNMVPQAPDNNQGVWAS